MSNLVDVFHVWVLIRITCFVFVVFFMVLGLSSIETLIESLEVISILLILWQRDLVGSQVCLWY
ncbi:hypothetical protein HanRHA438_Chr05g0226751 [Helianthus annuus]|nr:hypothetical protein HanRHA438_Chr05g0226751 [Helianthus annuus]